MLQVSWYLHSRLPYWRLWWPRRGSKRRQGMGRSWALCTQGGRCTLPETGCLLWWWSQHPQGTGRAYSGSGTRCWQDRCCR